MVNKQRISGPRLLAYAVLVTAVGFFSPSVYGADPHCYDLASLQGNYSIITNYGDNVAKALGVRYYDGNGNFTGSFTINQPKPGSTTGERTLVGGSQSGTYTVNCDGTGVINRIVTLTDGTTATQADDFVITAAVTISSPPGRFFVGRLIATAIADAGRVPSPIVSTGLFVTHEHTRLPDRQVTP